MKRLTYYSKYPYERQGGCKYVSKEGEKSTYYDFPFQLYKAAECETTVESLSNTQFVKNCFEAMDCPNYRNVEYDDSGNYLDKDYNVKVSPTKHFYGATNSDDGIYELKDGHTTSYLVMHYNGTVKSFNSWKEAVDFVFINREAPRLWLRGIDYSVGY